MPALPSLKPLFHKVVDLTINDMIVGESAIPVGTPLFEASPPAVFFIGFDSAGVYEAAFKLRLALTGIR